MKIETMREFIVFSEYLNFTMAAKKLYTTQPGLSYRIASMEKELGFQLVDRGGADVRLTPAGKVLLKQAQKIMKEYDTMLTSCRQVLKESGRLIIEGPAGMPKVAKGFETLVSSFARSNPGIDVKLAYSDGRLLRDVLLEGVADIGVMFADYDFADDPDLCNRVHLVRIPSAADTCLYVWMSEDHPLAHRDHLLAEDLDGCPFAMQSEARFRIGWSCIERIFSRYGVTLDFRGKPGKDRIDFLWGVGDDELALSDVGWHDMHSSSFESVPHRVLRRIENPDLAVETYLVWLDGNINPALECFLDHVKQLDDTSELDQ